MVDIISVLLNLLRVVSWPNISFFFFFLENVSHVVEKNMNSLALGCTLSAFFDIKPLFSWLL